MFSELWGSFGHSGVTGSLAIFFRSHLGMNNAFATELSSAFMSFYYCTPLLGGYVSDKCLGPFRTMMLFYPLLVAGLTICVIGAIPSLDSAALCLIGLFVFAVGCGGVNSNVVVLGADQFDLSVPAQDEEKDSFFNWLYWSWSIGGALSFALLTNLAVNGFTPLISAQAGFFGLFSISLLSYVIAFGVVYLGKARYRQIAPQGSVLELFCSIVFEAGLRSTRGRVVLSGVFAFVPGILLTTVSYFVEDESWHLALALAGAFSVVYAVIVMICSGSCTKWVHEAMQAHGGSFNASQVHDVAQVMRLMPYMSFVILFWTVYAQQSTNFMLQGCQMDLRYHPTATSSRASMMSSAMLSILGPIVIIVFVPLFDRVLFPFLTLSCGIHVTSLRKMGMGLFCTCLCMVLAAWLEQQRKTRGFVNGGHTFSNCANRNEEQPLPMSLISVWWQTPQYLLIGFAEILTSISSHEMFYSEVPESMRSVCQAFNFLTGAFGYIVSGGINSLLSFWIPSDLNDGRLELVFYAIAAMAFVNASAFVWVSQQFVYRSSN